MAKWLRGYSAALVIGWPLLAAAGVGYARIRGVPASIAFPALAAFLLEYCFYLLPAFPDVREQLTDWRLPCVLAASAVAPYLAACAVGAFSWIALAKLLAVALVLGLWFYALPGNVSTDIGFLGVVAFLILSRYLQGVYPRPHRAVDLSVLGKLAVMQMAVLALMVARRVPETGYGFIPRWRDWRIGALNFLWFAPVGLALILVLKATQFRAA
jgi:hypothetical protein